MIDMGMVSGWRERYGNEVREDVAKYEKLNKEQPVTVREMTEKEKQEIFETKRESCHRLKVTYDGA